MNRSDASAAASVPSGESDAGTVSPQQIVEQIANNSRGEADFLHRLAAHLGETFSAAVVAVQDASFPQPRMLVREESIAAGLDRSKLRAQIDAVSPAVASFAIDLKNNSVDPSGGSPSITAIGVELLPAPQSAKVLVIQGVALPASEVLLAMKSLGDFAAAARKTMGTAETDTEKPRPSSQTLSVPAAETRSIANAFDSSRGIRSALRAFHADLDPTATAYRIASELPRLLPCERAVVLLSKNASARRPRFRVAAISGSSVIDRRSPLVRSMNQLADAVSVLRRPLILPPPANSDATDPAALSPQLVPPLETYLDESGVLSVALIPLFESLDDTSAAAGVASPQELDEDAREKQRRGSMPIAILMLETFSGEPPTSITPAMSEVAEESCTAISNAMRYDSVFALPVRRPAAAATRRATRYWILAIGMLVVAGLLAGWFIHVDHHVVATGVARPAIRQAIFAGIDGVVDELQVQDGDVVKQGDVLLTLDNAELNRETEALSGQLATATQKLSSIRAMLLAATADARDSAQSILEQQTLENQIESLNKRLEINREMKAMLSIVAPFDGQVVGWRLDERLNDRPVSRGDRLFAVVQHDGPWQLELKLEETRAGEVIDRQAAGETLPVRFAIETRPTETYSANVSEIGGVARKRADGRNVVDIIADIHQVPEDGFRGDAEVTAKIVCGRRRYLASAFDDVVAWFHRNILFRFRT
ncbi:efflux RND transporter periplasmic adaptor subunit [Rhodopirellula sp. P2]|uniref:efflux RND transporter periplasmic adaptor subunit n=1 Tax=Rhodopirellula sp. P2 TaxID=2127060 RepID=UPI00236871DC|nr:HlyD family efflux transporter periplasmic adaptor subunit [Rhodopirellula sp. P2]WDQ15594.1 biotin/lipoyl-binding protein [Rhodopirellula sp. P2]